MEMQGGWAWNWRRLVEHTLGVPFVYSSLMFQIMLYMLLTMLLAMLLAMLCKTMY